MDAVIIRDKAWENSNRIPSWVRRKEIDLDQFNTSPEVAQYCWQSFQEILSKDKVVFKNYKFVEPSAGTGAFYDLLPVNRRIGIDVEKFKTEYKKIF